MLPEGLKILQPKTKKRATSDDVSLGWRATYYTAVTRMNDDEAEELFSERQAERLCEQWQNRTRLPP
jgi:hypothetical protein